MSAAGADLAAANTGAGKVRVAFDEAALARWMAAHVEGFAGPMVVEQFNGGQSNPTYRLTTPAARYVLRRKPPGPLLKGAHDVLREALVQQALYPTDVPVARIFAVCEDESVIGSAFYVMDMVEGRVFWDAAFSQVPKDQRAACFDEMNRVIAALHSVDHVAVGLGDYGRPGNYFARQIGLSVGLLANRPQTKHLPIHRFHFGRLVTEIEFELRQSRLLPGFGLSGVLDGQPRQFLLAHMHEKVDDL